MNGPRHLWSGDWEDESSARAAELARQRGLAPATEEPETPAPEPKPAITRPRRSGPTVRERIASMRQRHGRQLRVALIVGVLVLVTAGVALAVGNAVSGGHKSQQQQASVSGPRSAWLGVEMVSSPSGGVMVARVSPKSPALAAGIRPGDVITQIDTEPIVTPAIAAAAIDGLQAGDHVDIQVQRGASTYTAHVTLASPPKKS